MRLRGDRISVGQLLFRVGAFHGLELQAQANSLVFSRGGEEDHEGLEDLGLGAKLRIISDGPAGMSLSLLTALSLPKGSESLTSDEAVPALSVLADFPLAFTLGLSANLGFAGYAGFFADSGPRHFVEGGMTWIPGPGLQLHINGGVDVDTGDGFFGVGVATRWFF